MQQELSEDLKEINRRLRVKIETSSFMRELDKCFNQTSKYEKGDGDTFRAFIEECHPDTILCHIKITIGSRQDISCSNAGPIYMNLTFYIDFLDKRLMQCKHSNILEENSHALLSSLSMLAII